MAAGSVADIQNALIALVKTIDDPNNVDGFAGAGSTLVTTTLPYFWIRRGRLIRRNRMADGVYEYVREYPLLLYVEEYCGVTDTAADTKTLKAANWIEPLFDTLDARYLLKTPLSANCEIMGATDHGDVDLRGIEKTDWFAGQVYLLQVRTLR